MGIPLKNSVIMTGCAAGSWRPHPTKPALGRANGGRLVRALNQLPEKTVTGPVMQLTGVADGRPVGRLRRQDDLAGLVDLRLAGGHGLQDGANLVGVDAPHAGVTQLSAAFWAAMRMASVFLNSVTTQCEGTLPWAWQALAISSLARSTSGWVNCP
jgi:hypothetical protein